MVFWHHYHSSLQIYVLPMSNNILTIITYKHLAVQNRTHHYMEKVMCQRNQAAWWHPHNPCSTCQQQTVAAINFHLWLYYFTRKWPHILCFVRSIRSNRKAARVFLRDKEASVRYMLKMYPPEPLASWTGSFLRDLQFHKLIDALCSSHKQMLFQSFIKSILPSHHAIVSTY